MENENTYTLIAKILHWATAAIALIMLGLGWSLDDANKAFIRLSVYF